MHTRITTRRRSRTAGVFTVAVAVAAIGLGAPGALAQAGSAQPPNSTGSPEPVAADTATSASSRLASGTGLTTAQQQAVDQAEAQAAKTGETVPISALTSESWQISARPGGGLLLNANPVPVRTLQHGSWVPIDTTLKKNSDGTYSPLATAYGTVRLSGGGSSALATTITASGASYRISWPSALPTPAVAGSTATYSGVLPGVDLQMTATAAGGFSEVLVVHDAKAAANPELDRLTLGVHTSGTHAVRGELAGAGDLTLSISGAMMWDSNTALASASATPAGRAAAGAKVPSPAQIAASDPSTPEHAGYAAHTAPLQVAASNSSLTLVPDRALLTGKGTVFPAYIDPTLQWHTDILGSPAYDETKQGSPCDSQPYYNDSAIDPNQLGVGWTNTYCGGYQRTFYQWQLPSALNGAHVQLASVKVTEDWQASFSCSESRTVDLHWSVGIGKGTDYDNTHPGYLTGANAFTTSATVGAAYNPSGCQSPAVSPAAFTVTTPVQWSTDHNANQISFAMDQGSNTNYADFDRFTDNPTLNIQFDHAPTTPAASQLSASINTSDKAACATASPYPYIGKAIVGSQVTLNAAKISSVDGDQLRATFKYWINGSSTTATVLSADSLASGSTAQGQLPLAFTQALTTGQQVDWQVQTTNGTYTSGWSPVCGFIAEPTGPDEPTITANSTYPDNVTGAPAGTSATFTVTANNDGAAAVEFYYNLDTAPPSPPVPASETATATNNVGTFTITPTSPGQHTLYVEAVDAAGDVSGTNSYAIIAASHPATTCASLAACYNNTAISADASPTQGNADGNGTSLSATTLANAGWTSGGNIVIDGADLALPTFGTGHADNVLAANQTVTCTSAMGSCTTSATGASSLMFLTTATYGVSHELGGTTEGATAPYIPDNSLIAESFWSNNQTDPDGTAPIGYINYSDGTSAPYNLAVPDWETGPSDIAAVNLPYFNTATGKKNTTAHVYAFSVPLTPGKTISSVSLPDMAGAALANSPALHIFSIGTRDTTAATVEADGTTATPATGQSWTGAWASDTEGNYNFESGDFNNQSFRVLLQPTVTGTTLRVKLDNSLGTSPLTIGGATVATTTGNAITPTAATSSTPVALSFGKNNNTGVTIPEGGMVFSNPLPFNVTAGQWLAVSFYLQNSVPYLVQHSWATDSYEYVAPIGSGNHTSDTAPTTYTASGSLNGTYTDLVTGLDVQTAGLPTQIVLGDNLIDAWQPNTAPLSPNNGKALRLSDDIAAASATTPTAYGTINAGIESNQLVKDNPEILNGTSAGEAVGGQAALTRIDRDLLDEPGLNTVIADEGLEDVLAGTTESAIENGYVELLDYLNATAVAYNASTAAQTFPSIVDVGLTPCDTYNGDGAATGNDPCNSSNGTVDATRTDINEWLANSPNALGPWSTTPYYYIDPDATIGTTDAADGSIELAPLAKVGTSRNNTPSDPVNLTNAGTAALANAILAATDTWQLDDGTGSTTADDVVPDNSANAYLTQTDPTAGENWLTLSASGYTWPTANVGTDTGATVLQLDGSSGYGATSSAVLNTAGSFSVSAWANLSSIPTGFANIAAQAGSQASGFYLQYNPYSKAWCMNFMQTDTANAAGYATIPCASTTPTANTWYHLVGTYNATTHTAQLYVNGTLAATTTGITNWSAGGAMLIGADQYDAIIGDFFPGEISDVQTFNYVLSAPQVTALYDQID